MLRGNRLRPSWLAVVAWLLATACADTRHYCKQALRCDAADAAPRLESDGEQLSTASDQHDADAPRPADELPHPSATSDESLGNDTSAPTASVVPSVGPAAMGDASAPAGGDQDPELATSSSDASTTDEMQPSDAAASATTLSEDGPAPDANPPSMSTGDAKDSPDAAICSTAACRTWAPTLHVSGEGGAWDARVALTSSGLGVTVWQPMNEAHDITPQLIAQVYDPSARAWDDPVTIAEDNEGAQFEVFPDGPNAFVVIWENAELNEIQSRRFDGTTWGVASTLVLGVAGFQLGVDAGRPIISWREYDEDEGLHHVRTRSWNPSSHTWGPRISIQATELPISDVFTATGQDGSAFAVWHEVPENEDPEVWASRIGPGETDWAVPEQIGTSIARQTGTALVVNERGDLIGRWIGYFQGALWDNTEGLWAEIDMQAAWSTARICTLRDNDPLMIERDADGRIWSQRWNHESAELSLKTQLDETPKGDLFLACGDGVAVAAWNDTVRIWTNDENSWKPAHRFDAGFVLGVAVSANGSILVARGTVSENGDQYVGLELEHFE